MKVKHFIEGRWVTNLTYAKYLKQGMDLTHRYWKNFPKILKQMKYAILAIAILLGGCKKEQPATKFGDPLQDTIRYQQRIGEPDPTPNYVYLTNVSVTSYEVDFSWIWGKTNLTHGGGGITLGNLVVSQTLPNHGGFQVTGYTYTNYPGSSLITLTITGHSTFIKPTFAGVEIIPNDETTVITVQYNANNGYFSISTKIKL